MRRLGKITCWQTVALLLFAARLSAPAALAAAQPEAPLVLIGIDGGDWRVIDPLVAQGQLPNISRLLTSGARGVLLAPEGHETSPPSWTSISTGKRVDKHGVVTVVPRAEVRATPFWEAAAREGKRVFCLNWICNYGAKLPPGNVLISGPYMVSYSPPEAEEQVRRLAGEYRNDVYPRGLSGQFLHDALDAEQKRADIAADYAKHRFDLLAVAFTSSDRLSHFFWTYHEPPASGVPADLAAQFGDAINGMYRAIDSHIGRILSAYAEPVNVILFSDHGFQSRPVERFGYNLLRPNAILAEAGLTTLSYDGAAVKEASVCWEDLAGFRKTRRMAVVMNPEHAAEMNRVQAALASVHIGADPNPVFDEFQTDGLRLSFHVRDGEFTFHAPARFTDGTQTIERAGAWFVSSFEVRSGIHRREGIVLLSGPAIRAGVNIGVCDVYDIAPTACYLLDMPAAEDMDGRLLGNALRSELLAARPPRAVATFDVPGGQTPSQTDAGQQPRQQGLIMQAKPQPSFDDEVEQRLRSLGYIE